MQNTKDAQVPSADDITSYSTFSSKMCNKGLEQKVKETNKPHSHNIKHSICKANQVLSKLFHKSYGKLTKNADSLAYTLLQYEMQSCKTWEPYTYRTLVSYFLGKAERGDQSKVGKGRREKIEFVLRRFLISEGGS